MTLDHFPETHCWFKKRRGWKVGQKVAFQPCDSHDFKPKFQFEYDPSTGLIHVLGSKGEASGELCVTGAKLSEGKRCAARIAICDASDANQTFDYEQDTGLIRSRADSTFCAQIADGDDTIRFNKCVYQSWGK